MRSLLRTCSLFAGGMLIVACSDPDLKTDLDSEGAPEVNIVTVSQEGAALSVNGDDFFEAPTFCRTDGGRLHREICPVDEDSGAQVAVDPRTDVIPVDWSVRVVFSELVDPNIEDLVTLENGTVIGELKDTAFDLSCGGAAMAYGGHYDPSGNDVSAPPGPSIFASVAGLAAPTGSECSVTVLGAVTDKEGNGVSGAGPFTFTLANLHVAANSSGGLATQPEQATDMDGNVVEAPDVAPVDDMGASTSVTVDFNAPVNLASIDTADMELFLADDTPVASTIAVAGAQIAITPDAGFLGETSYKFVIKAGSTIEDASMTGGVFDAPEEHIVLFKTAAIPPAE